MRKNNFVVCKNVRNSKQALVESIMTKIEPIIKNTLNEKEDNEHIVTFYYRVGISVDLDGDYEEAYKEISDKLSEHLDEIYDYGILKNGYICNTTLEHID